MGELCVSLDEACDVIVDCPHTTAKDEGAGIPLIRTPNVGKGRLCLVDVHRVSEDVYQSRIARAVPCGGDLILAREAPAGNVAVIPDNLKVCLGQRTMLLRPNKKIADSYFLAYYLNAPSQRSRLIGMANGATVSHINVADVRKLEVRLPPLEVQHRIASVLSCIDGKIEVNAMLNGYLAA